MPIDDVSRLGVSNWIRSMLYFEHRRQNALIPRPEELKEKGGAKSEAIIKGKKYKGGLVIEPKSGVHFNVSVLDFASLYPSSSRSTTSPTRRLTALTMNAKEHDTRDRHLDVHEEQGD